MNEEANKFEQLWNEELVKARETLDKWLEDGSEELLVQKLIEEEEMEREQARESIAIASTFAFESLAKLQVLKRELEKQVEEASDEQVR